VDTLTPVGGGVADTDLTQLREAIAAAEPAYLADLERLVNTDCGSYTPEGVDEIGRFVAGFLADVGAEVEARPDPGGRFGSTIVGTFRGDATGPRIVLIGVDIHAAVFLEVNKPKPVVLFELAKGWLTGEKVEPGETHELNPAHRPVPRSTR